MNVTIVSELYPSMTGMMIINIIVSESLVYMKVSPFLSLFFRIFISLFF